MKRKLSSDDVEEIDLSKGGPKRKKIKNEANSKDSVTLDKPGELSDISVPKKLKKRDKLHKKVLEEPIQEVSESCTPKKQKKKKLAKSSESTSTVSVKENSSIEQKNEDVPTASKKKKSHSNSDEGIDNNTVSKSETNTKKEKKKKRKQISSDEVKKSETELGQDTDNTSEVVKKKKKKNLTKSERKKLKNKHKQDEKKAEKASLEYLRCWKKDRENWSFQKVRQVWLLKNMYNEEKMSEEDFSILLKYLVGLQGASRKTTVEKAEQMMKDSDAADDAEAADNAEADDKEKKEKLTEVQQERVRQVLQLL